MYATPKVKFVLDRRKRASKTTNWAIEVEVSFAGHQLLNQITTSSTKIYHPGVNYAYPTANLAGV